VRGKTELYERLLGKVGVTAEMLEAQLADEGNWVEPKRVRWEEDGEGGKEEVSAPAWEYDAPTLEEEVEFCEEEERDFEHTESALKTGFLGKSFRYVYFRSRAVRALVDGVGDALWSVRCEYEEAQSGWEEDYDEQETDVDDWGTPEVVAISVV